MKNMSAKANFSPGQLLLPAEKGVYNALGLEPNLPFSSRNLSGLKTQDLSKSLCHGIPH